jgi:hypothetical protein
MAARGGVDYATKQFNVSKGLLDRLRTLSSRKGERKPDAVEVYSADETAWLEATVRALIGRLGETVALDGLPEINVGNVVNFAKRTL